MHVNVLTEQWTQNGLLGSSTRQQGLDARIRNIRKQLLLTTADVPLSNRCYYDFGYRLFYQYSIYRLNLNCQCKTITTDTHLPKGVLRNVEDWDKSIFKAMQQSWMYKVLPNKQIYFKNYTQDLLYFNILSERGSR